MKVIALASIIYFHLFTIWALADTNLELSHYNGNITHTRRIDVNKYDQCTNYELSSLDDKLYISAQSIDDLVNCTVTISALDGYSINFKFQSEPGGEIKSRNAVIKIFDMLDDARHPKYTYDYSKPKFPTKDVLMITSKTQITLYAPPQGLSNIGIIVSSEEAPYIGYTLGVMALSLLVTLVFVVIIVLILRYCGCIKPAVSREENRERMINRLRAAGYNVTRNYYGAMDRGPVPYHRLANENTEWGKMVFQPVVSNREVPRHSTLDTPPPEYETLTDGRADIHCSENSAFTQVSPDMSDQPTTSGFQQTVTSPQHQRQPSDGSLAHSYHSATSQGYPTSHQNHTSPNQTGSAYPVLSPQLTEQSQNQNSAFNNHIVAHTEETKMPPPAFGSVD